MCTLNSMTKRKEEGTCAAHCPSRSSTISRMIDYFRASRSGIAFELHHKCRYLGLERIAPKGSKQTIKAIKEAEDWATNRGIWGPITFMQLGRQRTTVAREADPRNAGCCEGADEVGSGSVTVQVRSRTRVTRSAWPKRWRVEWCGVVFGDHRPDGAIVRRSLAGWTQRETRRGTKAGGGGDPLMQPSHHDRRAKKSTSYGHRLARNPGEAGKGRISRPAC